MARGGVIPLLLLALCYFAHFSESRRMGFYEDDHYFAAASMAWSPGDLWAWCRSIAVAFPMPQGRPVGFILGGVLPYVGYHLGGVAGMYAVGFAVVGANGVLFYLLLKRCLAPPMPLVGAILFVLFPADTTRPFLCHDHILFPAVTLTLVAAHLYLNGTVRSRLGAYALVLVALLTYETAVLPLVFLPLLRRARWDRRWAMGLAAHLAVLAALAAALFVARQALGESRAVEATAGAGTVVRQVVQGTWIGTSTAWGQCFRRALQGLFDIHDRRPRLAWLMPVVAAVVWRTVPAARATTAEGAALASDIRRAAAFAAAASLVAYVFCFAPPHFPPIFTEGRLTSTHLAATVPISVAFAAAAGLVVLVGSSVGLPRWTSAAAAGAVAGVYFTALFAAALDEQDAYVTIWQARRQFWTAVLDVCPDLTDRTVVICDGRIAPHAYVMGATSWSDYMVLSQCYRLGRFHRDPMAFVYDAGQWTASFARRGDLVVWQDGPIGIRPRDNALDEGNLILLRLDGDGRPVRVSGSIDLCGRPFRLRQPPTTAAVPYPTLPLYGLLTGRNHP